MIKIKDLTVSYPQAKALDQANLAVAKGEWVLVTGPSGCGKSTLGRVLCGLIPHSIPADVQGDIRIANFDPQTQPLAETAKYVGMVFQNPSSQLFHLKVVDEIAFGLRNLGFTEDAIRGRVHWALESTGLQDLSDSVPGHLSGGQKQCVAIASVLAMQPQVIVLDEPTASLDDDSIQRVIATLVGLREKLGITIVMIEHRLTAAMQYADRLVVMEAGKVVVDSTPQQVFTDTDLVSRLGLRRYSAERAAPWKTLIQANGRHQPNIDPILTMQSITAGYEGKNVIEDIDLNLYPGDFTALVGANGVGKSTLALVAAGLLKPSSGNVQFQGGKKPKPGKDVSLLFQNPIDQLFTECVDEEIAFGPRNYGCFELDAHRTTLEQSDLIDLRRRSPLTLSIGQQHRTALAACVSLRPRVVILDEPTLGQDWGHLQQIMGFLQQLCQQGMAVLLITHDYKLVYRYAHKILLLEDGRIQRKGVLAQKKQYYLEKENTNEVVYS
ncbi:MAG TPA: ATP-binding cassette domain-containing protein [Anaerolineales bacterium]|nr:ATP-binding cassette domain-containing protein [Anaerolineales bacterium]